MSRSLSVIAFEIRSDWSAKGKGVSPYAEPYLRAMETMNSITDDYYYDTGDSVVRYFLANANGWRGEAARRIKAELRGMLND
jgi:hypothetical protein